MNILNFYSNFVTSYGWALSGGIQRTFQLSLSTGKGGNQRAEMMGGGAERHHSHSGRGELTLSRQQG